MNDKGKPGLLPSRMETDGHGPCRTQRHMVLVSPEIHWNTGNIGRTCLGTGARLHLIKPLGFSLESREIKRAGLDYWAQVALDVWESFDQFLAALRPVESELFLFSKSGRRVFWSMKPTPRMFLLFGSETKGLPRSILDRYRQRIYSIPILGTIRSLNLSTAAGIALYESLRENPASLGNDGTPGIPAEID